MVYDNCSVLGLRWCIVTYVLLGISCILLLLTVTFRKIALYIVLFMKSRTNIFNRDLVFLGQFTQTLAMSIHYAFIGNEFNIIFLLQEYFLSVQYSLVFYYFIAQLAENMSIIKKIKIPLIILNFLMLSGFMIYLIVYIVFDNQIYNCNNGIWIYLHSCGLILSIIFIILGYFANKTLQELKKLGNILIDSNKLKHFW